MYDLHFFDGDKKKFKIKIKLLQNIFCVFYSPEIEFCVQTNVFQKKLHANVNCLSA